MINNIQWFPRHMQSGLDKIDKIIKHINIIIEVRDARAIDSTKYSFHDRLPQHIKLITVVNKSDLISESALQELKQKHPEYLFISNQNIKWKKDLLSKVHKEATKIHKNEIIKNPFLKTLIIGCPNVGKSTIINQLKNKKSATTKNIPGVTREIYFINISDNVYCVDTPGILVPKLDTYKEKFHLSLIFCLPSDRILDIEPLSKYFLIFISWYEQDLALKKFDIKNKITNVDELETTINELCEKLKMKNKNDEYNQKQLYQYLLQQVIQFKIKVCFELSKNETEKTFDWFYKSIENE